MPKPIPFLRGPHAAEPSPHVPEAANASRVLEVGAERMRAGVVSALATVVSRRGSAPSTPGQKLLLAADGTCVGTIGGGAVEREVLVALDSMLQAIAASPTEGDEASESAHHHLRTFKLGAELGMCCGGSVDVMLEPLVALIPCLIVGAGHVSSATAPLLSRLGFAVTVCDEREDYAIEGRIPGVAMVLGSWDEAARGMARTGAVLVMTHDHAIDQDAIEWALREGFAFVGGVGSRAKAARTRDRLEAKGFSPEDRGRFRMPIGLEIGARLPDEIAVSVAAEMIAWKHAR